jgi:flagellar protein FliS
MNTYDSAFAYRQSTTFGATPVGQIISLYDTMLRDLHRASSALAAGQVEQRVTAVNHALLVIGELQGVLDFERGGEPARNLENFYKVTRKMISDASMHSSCEMLQEAIGMVTRVRAAWVKIQHIVPATGETERVQPSMAPAAAGMPQTVPAAPDYLETSSHGGWRA